MFKIPIQKYIFAIFLLSIICILFLGCGIEKEQKLNEKGNNLVQEEANTKEAAPENKETSDEEIIFEKKAHGKKVDEGVCGDSINWCQYEDGTVYISGTGEMQAFESEVNAEISPWKGNKEITELYVEDGVTSIGKSAFADCVSLKKVYISESVEIIYESAFENTPWLIEKQNENPLVVVNGVLIDGKRAEGSVYLSSEIKTISNQAFMGNQLLTGINLVHIEKIGESAFENCTNLQSVLGLDSLSYLGKRAFQNCVSLKEIGEIGGMEILEEDVFRDCISLTTVNISNYINQISESTFAGCINLILKVKKDSIAYDYAIRMGISYELKSQEELQEEIEAYLEQIERNVKENSEERKKYVESLIEK